MTAKVARYEPIRDLSLQLTHTRANTRGTEPNRATQTHAQTQNHSHTHTHAPVPTRMHAHAQINAHTISRKEHQHQQAQNSSVEPTSDRLPLCINQLTNHKNKRIGQQRTANGHAHANLRCLGATTIATMSSGPRSVPELGHGNRWIENLDNGCWPNVLPIACSHLDCWRSLCLGSHV